VVKPKTPADITATLTFIRKHSLPFVVRGGGHSTSGSSAIEDGLVIDLSLMRKVTVDAEAKTITAEGGTIWEDVDVEAAKHGLATVGGTVNHTGVGEWTVRVDYRYVVSPLARHTGLERVADECQTTSSPSKSSSLRAN
jgi:FAD/FMN-containing dehydrogenase